MLENALEYSAKPVSVHTSGSKVREGAFTYRWRPNPFTIYIYVYWIIASPRLKRSK